MNRRRKRISSTPTMDAVMAHVAHLQGSQRANAAHLGLTLDKYQKLCNGHRAAALADLDKLAKALGLSILVLRQHKEPQAD